MYKNKVCVFYWCLYGRCVINGLEQNIKTKLRQTFLKKIFSNLMSRFSIIIQIIAKNRLGLLLFSRDGRVIAKIHIFFGLCLIQLKGLNPQKISFYTSVSLFSFFSAMNWKLKTLNYSPILKQVILSVHSSRISSA